MKTKKLNYWKREDGFTAVGMAIVSAVSAVASTVVGISAAQTQAATQKYNSTVAKNNADLAQQQAASDAQKIRERGRRLVGAQKAALSAAGVDSESGSSIDVMYDSATQNELDRLTTLYKGNVSATGSLAQSQLDLYHSKQTSIGGYLGAGGTLLGGISGIYSDYKNNTRPPSFNPYG